MRNALSCDEEIVGRCPYPTSPSWSGIDKESEPHMSEYFDQAQVIQTTQTESQGHGNAALSSTTLSSSTIKSKLQTHTSSTARRPTKCGQVVLKNLLWLCFDCANYYLGINEQVNRNGMTTEGKYSGEKQYFEDKLEERKVFYVLEDFFIVPSNT
jgi:hypothetical protein